MEASTGNLNNLVVFELLDERGPFYIFIVAESELSFIVTWATTSPGKNPPFLIQSQRVEIAARHFNDVLETLYFYGALVFLLAPLVNFALLAQTERVVFAAGHLLYMHLQLNFGPLGDVHLRATQVQLSMQLRATQIHLSLLSHHS